MGATVTNEDLGITTKTSDHTAATVGPTDVCYDPPKQVPVPHPNHVTTDKAVEHTSGKTLFQNGNVVRVGEAITPSDPAHADTGGGVVSGTYREEARATSGSPNVRVEGKPPARTDDPTTQNHSNTTGKIFQVVPPGLLDDNPEEFFKRCSYDTSKIKAGDDKAPFVDNMPQIDTKRGETITIEATRKNAKVQNAPPECVQPTHMKWLVSRSGGLTKLGAAVPERSEELSGDTITLDDGWNVPYGGPIDFSGEFKANESDVAKRSAIQQKNTYAQENAAARGSSRVENQDGRQAYQQVNQDRDDAKQIARIANTLRTFAEFLWAWRAYQDPLRILITGRACSGSVSYEVHCYPEGEYSFDLPLDGLVNAVQWLSRALTVVRQVGQLANVQVENSLVAPGSDVKISVKFAWKIGEEEEIYRAIREAELTLTGTLLEWKFEVSCPLTNFLSIIPWGGRLLAEAIGWLIQRMGIEASVGFTVEVKLSAQAFVSFKWTKAKGWHWDSAGIRLPIEFKFYFFLRVQVRDSLHCEGRAQVEANPAAEISPGDAGLMLKSAKFDIKVSLNGLIRVDVWFYSYEQTGSWEIWKTEVQETDLCTLISN
ncbi:PAAR-like domain-containing protein [Polyangium spumosum]|uniref:DUF4150 domain-containing protein n=1 Tax=Polyangium spumosum TaxID=889282 RepID=A0A6N7PPB6_9BACT|nr:PAAR-like domain-containing protein [Polyangium spumosum]MRG92160.1 DUF4150 domain-containing protein [Polyangium spumosum]